MQTKKFLQIIGKYINPIGEKSNPGKIWTSIAAELMKYIQN